MTSRYVQKAHRDQINIESGFKCAWCGVYLTERHHIHEYSLGGTNTADNLILLCPTCHREVHKNIIYQNELNDRKKQLNGVVDRSSGSLAIIGEPVFVAGGTKWFGVERIVTHNNTDYLKIEHKNNSLLVSLRLFDAQGRLICWMNRNRWWVENEAIFDFNFNKNSLQIDCDLIGCVLRIDIHSNMVKLKCRMYIQGSIIEFDDTKTDIKTLSGCEIIMRVNKFIGNKNSTVFNV